MPPDAGELEVGRIGRAHGIRGEVAVTFTSNRPERHAPGAVLRVGDRALRVTASRPHQGRWLLRFEGVEDRTAAEALLGAVLTADPLTDAVLDDGEYWIHELVGSDVVDVGGARLGAIVAVEANPAHDQLVLDNDALVPITFVVERRGGEVVVDVPDGLLDL
ncbi:MAG TPA: ribosome maturation factor RimM [Acidimicrobiia bacterium]|nr:ribosome maturation factor RimM [Acidimicrobiia bacterium]